MTVQSKRHQNFLLNAVGTPVDITLLTASSVAYILAAHETTMMRRVL